MHSNRRRARRAVFVAALAAVAGLVAPSPGTVAGAAVDPPPPTRPGGLPSDGGLRVESQARGAELVVVEVHHDGDEAAAEAAVAQAGGEVHGQAGDRSMEAEVPARGLADLEAGPHVTYVTAPTTFAPTATTGVEVYVTDADVWQAVGVTGAGVKVGIIDYFSGGALWDAAAAGDLPGAPTGQFCRSYGNDCTASMWNSSPHGVAVAEIVHEMAPDAELYVATATTTADVRAAIDYFADNGVDVVTQSLTAEYDGPGDGTGPIADVLDHAVDRGMVFVNSAGNSAGGGTRQGSYWRGTWTDTDNDGWLEFAPGDETMRTSCGFFNGLRWDDWAGNATDYDVLFYEDDGTFLDASWTDQTAGAPPIEHLNWLLCRGQIDIKVLRVAAGNGTSGDVLELMTNGPDLEHWQNAHSASAPMVDSRNPGMLAVGAIDPPTGTTIATYSSQGPTNDGRVKPDIAAPSCVTTVSYGEQCFNGTSAAAPVAAGALALAIEDGVGPTPATRADWLRARAIDRGAAGNDNVYGRGQLDLPDYHGSPFVNVNTLVDRQHSDFLGRAATTTELTTWRRRLATTRYGRGQLVADLRASADNADNVDPLARLYFGGLGRSPDRSGFVYWLGRKRAGTSTMQSIADFFVATSEFQVRFYGSNTQYVNQLYDKILHRPSDPAGLSYWVGKLNSGWSRAKVLLAFLDTPEARADLASEVDVAVTIIQMLRRSATSGEILLLDGQPRADLAEWAFTQGTYPPP